MKRPDHNGIASLQRVRELRRSASVPERRLWSVLRNRGIGRAKFRHQVWIGLFIVDFVCLEHKLVIEVDGDSHAGREEEDARRTAWLEREGYRVLRVGNDDVMRNLDGCAAIIAHALTLPPGCAGPAPPSPLQGEGR